MSDRLKTRSFRALTVLFVGFMCLPMLVCVAVHSARAQAPGDSAAPAPAAPAPAEQTAPPVTQAAPPAAAPMGFSETQAPAAPTHATTPPAAHHTPTAGHAAPAAAAPAAAAPAPEAPPADGGWPRAIQTRTGGLLIIYQPQLVSWKDQKHLVAMAALSYTAKGAQKAKLGTIRLESPTSTSLEDRMVNLQKVEITAMNFPNLEKNQTKEVYDEVRASLPKADMLVSLDRILAAADVSTLQVHKVKINTEPPPIFYSKDPAILVQFDGEMIKNPIEGTSLAYVVNTNWDVFIDSNPKNKTPITYLRNDTYWLQSKDMKEWDDVGKLPPDFEKLAKDDNWAAVRAQIPAKKRKGPKPEVFVSDKPAELILVDGSPDLEKVEGTDLSWVANSETDMFRYNKTKDYYVLLSGRWFKTNKLEKGPWSFATTDLPPDFAKIPKNHPRARVLSSVPGTEEANAAILLASIPTTAKVNAKEIKAPEVKYDGDPKFKAIKGSSVTYAENTGYDILKYNDTYYLCYQAVWFSSAHPIGPWAVATHIPQEIYSIPADSPVHNVTYVTVVDDDKDEPTYGYTAGYMGVTIAMGCVMYGSGWYYPPYYHYPGYGAPIYYPRPVAYGGGATYNPWTGSYGYRQTAYGPYGGVSRGASYNPNTGTYKRGAAAYGPNGAVGGAAAYNPRTGTAAATRQGSNAYGSWGSSAVTRGDNWAKTQRVTDAQGNTKWKAQGSGGGSAAGYRGENGSGFVGQKNGDVYAGKDGNVYRKSDSGWQQYNGRGEGWGDVSGGGNRPSAGTQPSAGTRPSNGSVNQLDRDATARAQGDARTRDYSNYQNNRSGSNTSRPSTGNTSRSSGSRSGGYSGGSRGGSRGGGGGRRR